MKKALTLLFLVAAAPALAQRVPDPTTPAIELGAATGRIAGNAKYCGFDPKLLEEYISLAKAQIALSARDRIDRVLAELDFSNNYSLAAASEPEGGCEAFLLTMPEEFAKFGKSKQEE